MRFYFDSINAEVQLENSLVLKNVPPAESQDEEKNEHEQDDIQSNTPSIRKHIQAIKLSDRY